MKLPVTLYLLYPCTAWTPVPSVILVCSGPLYPSYPPCNFHILYISCALCASVLSVPTCTLDSPCTLGGPCIPEPLNPLPSVSLLPLMSCTFWTFSTPVRSVVMYPSYLILSEPLALICILKDHWLPPPHFKSSIPFNHRLSN